MKRMKCLDCAKLFAAATPQEMMQKMHPHYMADHQDIMKDGNEEKKAAWMQLFSEAWEKAEEI